MSVRKPSGLSLNKSMALLSCNAFILAKRSRSWLPSRLQGTLLRRCLSLGHGFRQAGEAILVEPC